MHIVLLNSNSSEKALRELIRNCMIESSRFPLKILEDNKYLDNRFLELISNYHETDFEDKSMESRESKRMKTSINEYSSIIKNYDGKSLDIDEILGMTKLDIEKTIKCFMYHGRFRNAKDIIIKGVSAKILSIKEQLPRLMKCCIHMASYKEIKSILIDEMGITLKTENIRYYSNLQEYLTVLALSQIKSDYLHVKIQIDKILFYLNESKCDKSQSKPFLPVSYINILLTIFMLAKGNYKGSDFKEILTKYDDKGDEFTENSYKILTLFIRDQKIFTKSTSDQLYHYLESIVFLKGCYIMIHNLIYANKYKYFLLPFYRLNIQDVYINFGSDDPTVLILLNRLIDLKLLEYKWEVKDETLKFEPNCIKMEIKKYLYKQSLLYRNKIS